MAFENMFGQFGKPVTGGGNPGTAVKELRYEQDQERRLEDQNRRAEAQSQRAEDQNVRAEAAESRAAEKHPLEMEKEQFAFGRQKKEAASDDWFTSVKKQLMQNKLEANAMAHPLELMNKGIEAGEKMGWKVASDYFMAAAQKAGMKPSGIVSDAVPGVDEQGRPGYWLTDIDGERIQVNGENWFVPREPYEVEKGGLVRDKKTGKVYNYDDEMSRWTTIGDEATAGPGSAPQSAKAIAKSLTPMEKKFDEKMATELSDWQVEKPNAQTQLTTLRGIITEMTGQVYAEDPTGATTGEWKKDPNRQHIEQRNIVERVGEKIAPDALVQAYDPQLFNMKQRVEQVVQSSLKATLGGQFAAREADQLFARAYDLGAKAEENAARLMMLADQLERTVAVKDQMYAYFNQHRTMKGYRGQQLPTSQLDFYLGDIGSPKTPAAATGGTNASPERAQELRKKYGLQ